MERQAHLRTLSAALLAAWPLWVAAQSAELLNLRANGIDVPAELVRPEGAGPFRPVLFVHARRGYEDEERAHVRELASQGFLVLAPDWQKGRLIERWPVAHDPETEADVEAALEALLKRPEACKGPVGIVGVSRGPYYALRLAAKRPQDVAAIVSYYGHFQNPNAPEPAQIYSFAPEVQTIKAPVLMLIGEQDFEVRRLSNGRAFYALWERGVPVELQMYPLARRAFDFRRDQTPEERIATRHARQRAKEWLLRWLPKC
ncbi:MAG: dienelactone hydrolase [Betaproteobacteria bacterium RIFCSPLOWO2_02_FULL_66_14]|nr:MAG: dienelactone hydrolase [Betaproteobacteria bacterium RIFCSPLOWO2_02_FULL_66_14]